MLPAIASSFSSQSATLLPLDNTEKPTSYQPKNARGEPLAVHSGVELTLDDTGISLNVDRSLKHLLKLRSTNVKLNSQSLGFKPLPPDLHAPTSYDQNIPVQDRIYIHMSNDALVQRFVDKIAGFNGLEFDKHEIRPYAKVAASILHALRRAGERDGDIGILTRAFAVLEPFYSEHNYAVREAIKRRPDLKTPIKNLTDASAEIAVSLAMKGVDPHDYVPNIDNLIKKAESVIEAETEARLATASAEFFADPASITGNSLHSTRQEIAALANGRIYFKDIGALLRHAPVGTLHHEPIQYKYYNPHTKVTETKKYKEARVKYDGVVHRLYHYDTKENNMEDRSLVLTMANGYIRGNGAIQPYPENIPMKVRLQNLQILTAAVNNAQRRMAG